MISSTLEEAKPHRSVRGRRIAVTVLGATLAAIVCSIVGVALVQSSWWYSYGRDRALSHESWTRVERIRDEIQACGAAPEAAIWLEAALDPHADPTTVRTCLLAAQEALGATDDPELVEAISELRAVIATIRPSHVGLTTTPRLVPTVEWPWR
jgi:hypothetical protein